MGTLGAGGSASYSTLLTTRGSLKKLGGSRSLSNYENLESNTYELMVRYQSTLETNIKGDMKVEIESKTYSILSCEKIGETRFYYRFVLSDQRD